MQTEQYAEKIDFDMAAYSLAERYRIPLEYLSIDERKASEREPGFGRLARNTRAYGPANGARIATRFPADIEGLSASAFAPTQGTRVSLPFQLDEIVDYLRFERYLRPNSSAAGKYDRKSWLFDGYYLVRPLLPVVLRKRLQRLGLRGWDKILFPRWPLDCSVEHILETGLGLLLQAHGVERIPFVWFWPEGYQACAIMTHDVETKAGRDFCGTLMDMNDGYGLKSSFQVVPEERYKVPEEYLDSIRGRGFEIGLHGLNHDGYLFAEYSGFLRQAGKINDYSRRWGAKGFRSPVMYRNLDWYGAFEFSYDMSVPNVGHLDPQRGGCCTVFPYFVGDILELPLTTLQDYSLFNILNSRSLELWQEQCRKILDKHGLMSFLIHPDYIIQPRYRGVYGKLLDHLADLSCQHHIWKALPGDLDVWWRQRREMSLRKTERGWRIEGEGSERARLAYAERRGDNIVYTLDNSAHGKAKDVIRVVD